MVAPHLTYTVEATEEEIKKKSRMLTFQFFQGIDGQKPMRPNPVIVFFHVTRESLTKKKETAVSVV